MTFEERIFSALVEEILKARQALNAAGRGLEIKISKHGPDTTFKLTLTAGEEVEGVMRLTLNGERLAAKAEVADLGSLSGRCMAETARQLNWTRSTWDLGEADHDPTSLAERNIAHMFQWLTDRLGS